MKAKPTDADASATAAAPDLVSVRITKPDVTIDGAPAPFGRVIPLEKVRAGILVEAGLAEIHVPSPADDVQVRVRVLVNAAPLAGMICAVGHEDTYPKSMADLFVKAGLVQIIGV
jgi:hypothetical protein